MTRHPCQFWTAQQLREATADGRAPRFILRDNDSKYGSSFDMMARATGIEVKRTPIQAPKANAIVERYIGSVRRECLDHLLIFGERQLYRVIQASVDCFNQSRPHQGIWQIVPCGLPLGSTEPAEGKIISFPVLSEAPYTTSIGEPLEYSFGADEVKEPAQLVVAERQMYRVTKAFAAYVSTKPVLDETCKLPNVERLK